MSYPFLWHDGGKAVSQRAKERNDCTVRALAIVTGQAYDTVYDVLHADGRPRNRGFHLDRWLSYTQNPCIGEPQTIFGYRATYRSFPAKKGERRMNPVMFAAQFPKGRYICKTARHVYAVIDGVVHDLVEPHPDRCIYVCWEFVNV